MQGEFGLKDKEPIQARSLSDTNKTERVHVLCISDLIQEARLLHTTSNKQGEEKGAFVPKKYLFYPASK